MSKARARKIYEKKKRDAFLREPVDLSMSHRERRNRNMLMNKHYGNMRKIKPTIDTRDRERARRLDNYKRYKELTRNNAREKEIRRANEQLIEKITDIATSSAARHYYQEYPSKQRMFMTILAKHGRKVKQQKIARENQELAHRLLTKPSRYNRKKWASDWKHHDSVLKHLSKSAQFGIKKSKKKSPKVRRAAAIRKVARKKRTPVRSSGRLQKAGLRSVESGFRERKALKSALKKKPVGLEGKIRKSEESVKALEDAKGPDMTEAPERAEEPGNGEPGNDEPGNGEEPGNDEPGNDEEPGNGDDDDEPGDLSDELSGGDDEDISLTGTTDM